MKYKRFKEPLYKYELVFVAGCSFDEVNKVYKRLGLKPLPDTFRESLGVTCPFDGKENPGAVRGKIYSIWIKNEKDFYILLHEVVHLAIEVFIDKGMVVDDHKTSSEAFAYYVEYWFQTLWRCMNQKLKRK